MWRREQTTVTVVAVLVTLGALAGFAGTAAGDSHTKEEAPEFEENVDFTINFPHTTDHYPGDQNEENGSIEYFSAGAEAFTQQDAEEGIWMDYVIIDADWIDYSACDTENTAVYGIDRGNNNTGTQIDEDLVQYTRRSIFRDDGITVIFYDWSDFANDPPYLAPEDAQVAAQGAGSNGGTCLTVTSEPGWYNVQGFLNGTIANGDCTEQGNAECEPEDKEYIGVNAQSNYLYVCECDSEEEARERLGPPPSEDGGSDDGGDTTDDTEDTPTPTPAETDTDDGGDSDDSGDTAATPTPTPTEADTDDGDGGDDGSDSDGGDGDGSDDGNDDGSADSGDDGTGGDQAPQTPSVDDGPGFGGVAALLALLVTALLAYRRG